MKLNVNSKLDKVYAPEGLSANSSIFRTSFVLKLVYFCDLASYRASLQSKSSCKIVNTDYDISVKAQGVALKLRVRLNAYVTPAITTAD